MRVYRRFGRAAKNVNETYRKSIKRVNNVFLEIHVYNGSYKVEHVLALKNEVYLIHVSVAPEPHSSRERCLVFEKIQLERILEGL